MTKVIMHGCNGKMGQMITGLIAADDEIEIVAGVDAFETGNNTYPVFKSIGLCDIGADVVIDFSNAQAIDGLLDYCMGGQQDKDNFQETMEAMHIMGFSHEEILCTCVLPPALHS